MSYLAAFAAALALALVSTPLVRLVAWRRGYVARPRQDRWHQRPTALLGGVAVAVATLGGCVAAGWPPVSLAVLGLASLAVFVVGLVDDLVSLTPVTKVTFEIVAASLALAGGIRLEWTPWQTVDSVLTVLWLVGLTNAFNLLDNMDGACAGVGAIVSGVLVAIGIGGGMASALPAGWAAALGGALAGFLVFNFKPATIFLGDSGSLFIGFLLGGLAALAGGRHGPGFSAVALPVLVGLVPIFDTTLVTVARKLSGRPASQGGTDHTTHRLVALGFSESRAVLSLYLLAALSGAGGVLVSRVGSGAQVVVALLGLASILLAVILLRVRVYGEADFSLLMCGRRRALALTALLRHHVLELVFDVILITAAYYAAYRIRFDAPTFATQYFGTFLGTLPLLLGCTVGGLWVSGGYRTAWQQFRAGDLVPLTKGIATGTAAAVVLLAFLYRFENISRAVLVIHTGLLALFLAGGRVAFRFLAEPGARRDDARPRPSLVYGRRAGEGPAAERAQGRAPSRDLVALVTDDPARAGGRVDGIPAAGRWPAAVPLTEPGPLGPVIATPKAIPGRGLPAARAAHVDAENPLLETRRGLREVAAAGAPRALPADARPLPEEADSGRAHAVRRLETRAVDRAASNAWGLRNP